MKNRKVEKITKKRDIDRDRANKEVLMDVLAEIQRRKVTSLRLVKK